MIWIWLGLAALAGAISRRRPGLGVPAAALLVGFVGALVLVELRRYGMVEPTPRALPLVELDPLDGLRFGLLGAVSAYVYETVATYFEERATPS